MFHGLLIASASGQNKAESKKAAAKVALHKVAPKLYEDLFFDEVPPADESVPGQEAKLTPKQSATTNMEIEPISTSNEPVPNEKITIGGEEIHKRGASDEIFKTYKPKQVVEYTAKF